VNFKFAFHQLYISFAPVLTVMPTSTIIPNAHSVKGSSLIGLVSVWCRDRDALALTAIHHLAYDVPQMFRSNTSQLQLKCNGTSPVLYSSAIGDSTKRQFNSSSGGSSSYSVNNTKYGSSIRPASAASDTSTAAHSFGCRCRR